ncbi:hypothetical protein BDR04DRAFT_1163241 [Suillus decipiens]|nr:hypothetical protein BDR04DRAFT_1163241 [Suillus decipiens]
MAFLAFSVTGSPIEVHNSPITLPITRRPVFSNVTNLLQHDEACLAAFGESAHMVDVIFLKLFCHMPIWETHFQATLTSAITWVGAGLPYLSKSGINTNEPVAVDYCYGSFQGTIFEDELYFGVEQLTSPGCLGALPNSLEKMILTVTDRLAEQGIILRPLVGIFFQPIAANTVNLGDLSFGGTNCSIDITTTTPSSQYWGINQRITYGGTEILACTTGIVDSVCTFLYLAIDAYEKYHAATGGTLNLANGLLQISLRQYNQLHDLHFHIGDGFVHQFCSCDSVEAAIYPYDNDSSPFSRDRDSGSIIIDALGKFVALLTGGTGPTNSSDITFGTPIHQLWDIIKTQFPGANLYIEDDNN